MARKADQGLGELDPLQYAPAVGIKDGLPQALREIGAVKGIRNVGELRDCADDARRLARLEPPLGV